MGVETLIIGGLAAASALSTMSSARDQARSIADEGTIAAGNKANDIVRSSGKLSTSFLNAGISLEGGPMAALSQLFASGRTDINRIKSNADNSADNVISAARTKALSSLAMTAASAGAGNAMSGGMNSLGQTTGAWFDPSPMGPYQSPMSGNFWSQRF